MRASLLALLALCGTSLAAKLPNEYPRCSVRSADFESCLRGAIETVIHRLKEGEKSLGLPKIAPLYVDEITLDLGSGPISLVLNAKNISFAGLEGSSITDAKLDKNTHVLTVKSLSPRLRLDFQYKAKGKILVVPVAGDGPAFFEFENVETNHEIIAEPTEKKGKTYWTLKDYKVDVRPAHMECFFHELLKGNAQASKEVNNVLNREWKMFYETIKQPAEEAFGAIFKSMAMRVFDRIPINDIYLDL